MGCCKICLNNMCSGGCCQVDYKSLVSIAYSLKQEISDIGNNYSKRLKEGFSCKPSDLDFYNIDQIGREKLSKSGELILEYKKTRQLLDVVEKEIKNLYNGIDSCICTDSLCKTKDIALDIVGFNCLNACRSDLMIDSSGEQAWIDTNPYCVSRERWEEYIYKVCTDLKFDLQIIDFENIKTKCNLVYDIVREFKNCTLDFTLEKTEKDCRIQFNTLITTKDCNITYDTFRSLLECGITYNTIATAADCGITFAIDSENNCPMIVTLNDRYNICDLEEGETLTLQNLLYTFSIE